MRACWVRSRVFRGDRWRREGGGRSWSARRAALAAARQGPRGETGEQDLDGRLAARLLSLLAQQIDVALHVVQPPPGAGGLPRALLELPAARHGQAHEPRSAL